MKRFLLFAACFLFFAQAAAAQKYYITETQLQKLETICQNYKTSNQTLQSQVNELQQTADKLQKDCETLTESLQSERQITQTLNKSLKEYEISSSQTEAEKMQLLQDLATEKLKTQKARTTIVILSATIGALIIAGAATVYILLKLK